LSCDNNLISFELWIIFLTGIVGGFCGCSTIPLFYEACVEAVYPIAEGVTTGIVALMCNVALIFFLLVPIIPALGGTIWLNWSYCLGIFMSIVIILPFKEKHRRLNVDLDISD